MLRFSDVSQQICEGCIAELEHALETGFFSRRERAFIKENILDRIEDGRLLLDSRTGSIHTVWVGDDVVKCSCGTNYAIEDVTGAVNCIKIDEATSYDSSQPTLKKICVDYTKSPSSSINLSKCSLDQKSQVSELPSIYTKQSVSPSCVSTNSVTTLMIFNSGSSVAEFPPIDDGLSITSITDAHPILDTVKNKQRRPTVISTTPTITTTATESRNAELRSCLSGNSGFSTGSTVSGFQRAKHVIPSQTIYEHDKKGNFVEAAQDEFERELLAVQAESKPKKRKRTGSIRILAPQIDEFSSDISDSDSEREIVTMDLERESMDNRKLLSTFSKERIDLPPKSSVSYIINLLLDRPCDGDSVIHMLQRIKDGIPERTLKGFDVKTPPTPDGYITVTDNNLIEVQTDMSVLSDTNVSPDTAGKPRESICVDMENPQDIMVEYLEKELIKYEQDDKIGDLEKISLQISEKIKDKVRRKSKKGSGSRSSSGSKSSVKQPKPEETLIPPPSQSATVRPKDKEPVQIPAESTEMSALDLAYVPTKPKKERRSSSDSAKSRQDDDAGSTNSFVDRLLSTFRKEAPDKTKTSPEHKQSPPQKMSQEKPVNKIPATDAIEKQPLKAPKILATAPFEEFPRKASVEKRSSKDRQSRNPLQKHESVDTKDLVERVSHGTTTETSTQSIETIFSLKNEGKNPFSQQRKNKMRTEPIPPIGKIYTVPSIALPAQKPENSNSKERRPSNANNLNRPSLARRSSYSQNQNQRRGSVAGRASEDNDMKQKSDTKKSKKPLPPKRRPFKPC